MNPEDIWRKELDVFLDRYYDFGGARAVLVNLQREQYSLVRGATKEGLEQGVADFLEVQRRIGKPAASLYEADITRFTWDTSTQSRIERCVAVVQPNLENILTYASDVCRTYGDFVLNDSAVGYRRSGDRVRSTGS